MKTKSSKKRRPPSIDALRTLVTFCEAGSVSRTARQLGVTQPVVTRKLQTFRSGDACGCVLLKSTDPPTPTDAGDDALPAIRQLVQDYDQLLGYLRGRLSAPQLVRLGLGGFASQHYLPRLLALMRDAGANCELQATVARGEERIIRTARGEFQLAIVTHDPTLIVRIASDSCGRRTRLVVEPLGEQRMCVIARPNTPPGKELDALPVDRAIPQSKLREWEFVGLDPKSGIRRQLERQFPGPRDFQFVAQGGGWPAARECARLGLGVAILPIAALSLSDKRDFVIRRAPEQFTVVDYVIHRSQKFSPALTTVKDLLQQAVKIHREHVDRIWKQLV